MLESAYALRANGLRPLIGSIRPALVNNPNLIKSRRESCPCERALIISCRFFLACSASRKRAFEAFGDKKKFLSDICFSFVGEQNPEGLPQTMERRVVLRSSNVESDQVRRHPDADW
jgi:hypothetical protein